VWIILDYTAQAGPPAPGNAKRTTRPLSPHPVPEINITPAVAWPVPQPVTEKITPARAANGTRKRISRLPLPGPHRATNTCPSQVQEFCQAGQSA